MASASWPQPFVSRHRCHGTQTLWACVVGADSGHRYVLTSRQAPAAVLDKMGGRTVYDCDRGHAVCVHDWTVPAAEELLGIAMFLQVPGRERHVAVLPFEDLLGRVAPGIG